MKSAGSRRFWIILSFAVAVVLYVLFRPSSPVEVVQPKEHSRAELELKEGRWWRQGKPFTGILLEQYAEGAPKSRSAVSNGFLEGLSEGWYTNGVKQVTEHFVQGVSHGPRVKYHPNGKKLSTAPIVHGQIEGLYQRWHENGMLAELVRLTNGIPDGESFSFHPDGSLKARARLDQGKVIEQQFWEPGEVVDTAKVIRETNVP